MAKISVTLLSDPGCPWAYSAEPSLHALRWRYGDQLEWRIVTIGLAESPAEYEGRGYTPAMMAQAALMFGRFGMPFTTAPRPRIVATGRACRAIVAARVEDPELAGLALRALHLAWFTTDLLLDEDDALVEALSPVPGLDAAAVVGRIDSEEVEAAYQRDREETRTAAGSPASLQGKTMQTDGPERFSAPTLIFERGGRHLMAGGHQSLEVYDVLIANLDPGLRREPPPDGPLPLLERFPYGLVTREVAVLLAGNNEPPDDAAATAALVGLVAEGRATRESLGDGALWTAAAPASAP